MSTCSTKLSLSIIKKDITRLIRTARASFSARAFLLFLARFHFRLGNESSASQIDTKTRLARLVEFFLSIDRPSSIDSSFCIVNYRFTMNFGSGIHPIVENQEELSISSVYREVLESFFRIIN